MDLTQVWAIVREGGALGLAIVLIVAFWQGWVVPGRLYDRVVKERDDALALAAKNAGIAERLLDRRRP